MHDSWNAFFSELAEASRKDERRRVANKVGNILWVVIFSALITFAVGLWFQAMGWL